MLIQRIAELYGLSMVQEEEASRLESDIKQRGQEVREKAKQVARSKASS